MITYTEANSIAQNCEEQESFICKARDTYRDCDRPLCCGFCPTVDYCESVCSKLLKEWSG